MIAVGGAYGRTSTYSKQQKARRNPGFSFDLEYLRTGSWCPEEDKVPIP